MRKMATVLAVLFLSAGAANAQSFSSGLSEAPVARLNSTASPIFGAVLRGALVSAAQPAPAPAPQEVYGIQPLLYWQASVGFSYARFYEVPGTAVNNNGADVSMAYYFKPWIAGEAQLDAGFGRQNGVATKSVLAGPGVRLRWKAPNAVEVWIHGVAGGAYFSPKTSFGGDTCFGYEAGGGIDFKPHGETMAYRVEADVVGTSFFGTYQIGPKASAGVVFKF
jgi:hypothetical protein